MPSRLPGTPPEPAAGLFTLHTLVVGFLLLGLALLVGRCQQPPPAQGLDAPDSVFSAERAYQRLQDLLGAESPHPLGSTANHDVRERLVAQLEKLGLGPVTRDDLLPVAGTWSTGLAHPRNVVAQLPTSHPELPGIVLACHYDSVPAGPGAGDDGAAVAAILEVARILQAEAPLPRPVVLLFTDGEELGLHGAQAFALYDPLADRDGIILNFEARGTAGSSLLFETSPHNEWMIAQAARGLARPHSSSAYVDVYRRMPNSSDLTVFMQRRLAGMNFAFIGRPKLYHTPLDNLANLDKRSLQHHGENALGMVRQLLAADWKEAHRSRGDAVYTDLSGRIIIAWPVVWGPWLAGLLLVALYIPFRVLRARHRWSAWLVGRAAACWILVVVLAMLFAWLGGRALHIAATPESPWPAAMQWDLTVHCLLALVGVIVAVLWTRPPPLLFVLTHGLILALGGLILSLQLPSFSYLFLLPALPAALGAILLLRSGPHPHTLAGSCLATGVMTTILAIPFLLRLPEALGVVAVPPVMGAIMALLLLPMIPLFAVHSRRRLLRGGLGGMILASVVFLLALNTPTFTPESPQHLVISYLEPDGAQAAQLAFSSWEAPIPSSLLETETRLETGNALFSVRGILAETTPAGLPAPGVEILERQLEEETHRVRLRIMPSAPSQQVLAGIPVTHQLVHLAALDKPLPLPPGERDGCKWVQFRGVPEAGIDLEVTWRGPAALPLTVVGITSGLPPHLADLAARRDALPATASHLGDETIVVKQVLLDGP